MRLFNNLYTVEALLLKILILGYDLTIELLDYNLSLISVISGNSIKKSFFKKNLHKL